MSGFWDNVVSILPYATVVVLAPLTLAFKLPVVALALLMVSLAALMRNFGGFVLLPLLILHLGEMVAAAIGVYRLWS